jgi:hypothetical protein
MELALQRRAPRMTSRRRRAPAVTSVGPDVTPSAHLPRRPPKPRIAHGFPLLSPLPAAKGIDTSRPSPSRVPVQRTPGGEGQQRRRLVASPPPSSTHVAPPPELGPRAPARASRLAATHHAAMRRRCGCRGRHWPTAARTSLSSLGGVLDPPPSRAAYKKNHRSTRTSFSPFPSSAIAPPPWSSLT